MGHPAAGCETQVPFGNDKQREKAPSVVSRKFVEEITAGPSTSFAKKTANCAQDDNFIYVRIDDNFIYVRINDNFIYVRINDSGH